MIVVNDDNNLVYDSESPLCILKVEHTQRQITPLQCVDASLEEPKLRLCMGEPRALYKRDFTQWRQVAQLTG